MAAAQKDKDASGTAPGAETKENKKKVTVSAPVLIIGITVLILSAEFVAGYFFLVKVLKAGAPAAQASAPSDSVVTEGEQRKKKEPKKSVGDPSKLVFEITDMVVNPAASKGKRHLALNIAFKLETEDEVAVLRANEALIKDALISLLASKSFEYLSDVLNREDLRLEIIQNVNSLLPEKFVKNAYFTMFVLQ